ncbi:MAG TPA: hypothetical protein VJL54_08485, partial [Nitrososphaera sp.]|nr:hypothetical protein [Nitrososphaera sp.]
VVGVLGTEEQANIVIRLAETTIRETTENYPGIVLSSAQDLLQKAIEARDGERFPDAESLAFQANDAAVATAQAYDAARSAITEAEALIRDASNEGRDTSAAGVVLERARSEFNSGNYESARGSAENAVSSIGSRPQGPDLLLLVVIIGVVAAGGGIGAMLIVRSRKPRQAAPQKVPSFGGRNSDSQSNRNSTAEPPFEKSDGMGEASSVSTYTPPKVERTVEQSPAVPTSLPESQTDKLLLEKIVVKIVDEKPHLRPEDQDVLRYLAEKEGAAFESEIRSKFNLPKTTIWRLVKRLEREELVEIRKAGGQNLIKLKFESRLP